MRARPCKMAGPLAGVRKHRRPAVEPAAILRMLVAGSLVLCRMDRRGHKKGLVLAKKHGTKSGSGAPGGGFVSCLAAPQYTPGGKTNEAT